MNAIATTSTTSLTQHYKVRLGLHYEPSHYQAEIFDFIENKRGSQVVEAVAGSGKTSTIVAAAGLIHGDGVFFAFNKDIAKELGERLRGTSMQAKTVHSHGFAAIRYAAGRSGSAPEVVADKYKKLLRDARRTCDEFNVVFGRKLTEAEIKAIQDDGFPMTEVSRLFDLARLDLVAFDSANAKSRIVGLALHHGITIDYRLDDLIVFMVQHLAAYGISDRSAIDFTDMVWLPVVCKLRPRGYSWIFVDECQDISRAARALILSSVRRGGRILWVGDRRQAIYGFAGADARSFEEIVETTGVTPLPLSVCYRCPTSVIDVARELCPQIEARPGAPEGVVRTIKQDDLVSEVCEGDMILCRVTAPLVKTCFELIADGVAASVRGRNIGAGLCKIVDRIAKTATFEAFREGVDAWELREIEALRRRVADEDQFDELSDAVRDQAECLRIVYSRLGVVNSYDDLKSEIEGLFSDERTSVQLSTIHRAKGLEENRVFILEPDRLRKPRAARPWQLEQERNLAYVAFTRPKEELVFVEPPKKQKVS